MKVYFYSLMLLLFIYSNASAQEVTIKLVGTSDKKPLNLVSQPFEIRIESANGFYKDQTINNTGVYTFQASKGDRFVIRDIQNNPKLIHVIKQAFEEVSFDTEGATVKEFDARSAVSSKNYWVGAKVAYNLDGKSSDDIVGGTKIFINPSEIFDKNPRHSLGIIGNIGTFFSNTDKEDKSAAISKLAQSQTGIGIGLGYIYQFAGDDNSKALGRFELSSGYRLNSFKDPKVDSLNIGLSQFRNAVLVEAEIMKWKNGGNMTIGMEGSATFFSSTDYNRIFGESKSSRFALETTVMLPISKNIGFMVNMINTKGIKPVYQFGITFRTEP